MRHVKVLGVWMLVLLGGSGCGAIARDMAKQGTEGALESIQEQKNQKSAEDQATDDAVARRNAEQVARGMMDAVTQPERPAATAAGPEGVPPSGPGPNAPLPAPLASLAPGTGGSGASFSSALASQVAKGLSTELER
ncbi:hypothetical protein JYK02_38515 [Corallococcus macrosporus]|uniref:Uncharacterized protein n=1 Tax=Corallococcus macrosporus TaxID=35 RepID=A0ABS3DQ12_9BACT|nr:hypothetical protein [Corallococcus macrosporus]MBN8233429.1 hypothetical protein [Corallococcus macrosporus]